MIQELISPKQFFLKLNKSTMHLVDQFYDVNAKFQDPVVQLNSCEQVKNYYANMYKNVEMIRFTFSDETHIDNITTLVWTMYLRAPGLNGGKTIQVDGVSIIKFGGREGKAIYHRDYFDMGEFVYEGLPLIGGLIRFVKSRMAKHKEVHDEEV